MTIGPITILRPDPALVGSGGVVAGPPGPPGSVWYAGAGAPAGGLGVNGDLYLRSDTADVYTKAGGIWSITMNMIAGLGLAPIASPAFTGVPTAPTAAPGTNTVQLATTAFIQAAIAALINSAPGALDTLDELAAAFGDDPNFAATMTTALAGKQPIDAILTSIANLTTQANKLILFTGVEAASTTSLSPFMATVLDDADADTALGTLGHSAYSRGNLVGVASAAALTALLNTVTTLAKGLVPPLSGNGSDVFRGDGSFGSTPAGSGVPARTRHRMILADGTYLPGAPSAGGIVFVTCEIWAGGGGGGGVAGVVNFGNGGGGGGAGGYAKTTLSGETVGNMATPKIDVRFDEALIAEGGGPGNGAGSTGANVYVYHLTAPTISIASPGVVTLADHGLWVGQPVSFRTTGTLPTGLAIMTRYFVSAVTNDTFEVSATLGGASINTSGSQGGTHQLVLCQAGGGFGGAAGNGSTTWGSGGAGGAGLTGEIILNGETGGAPTFANANTVATLGGRGGQTTVGSNPSNNRSLSGGAANGGDATGYGSGGNGATFNNVASNAQGGDGAPGLIIFTEYMDA
jgi:hypothetical protein